MISIENELYTIIKNELITQSGDANFNISMVEQNAPAKFPAVSVVEIDNYTDNGSIDSSSFENYVNVTYEINVFSNKKNTKKSECKDIMSIIDGIMINIGFTRTMMNSIQNVDNSIYRMVSRYVARVDAEENIYRR